MLADAAPTPLVPRSGGAAQLTLSVVNMKSTYLILIALFPWSTVAHAEEQIRTEKKLLRDGKIVIEDTFRGKEKILRRMVVNGTETISYMRDGDIVYSETDEDQDGFRETIHIPGKTMDDFEQFIRSRNGKISPISSNEKSKKAQTVRNRMEFLQQALEKAANEAAAGKN